MKHSHLSNFQKQQYTAYLETQLQKFSAFMLSQKKENQKYKSLEQAISHQGDIIDQLKCKAQMNDLYHNQSLANYDNLFKKCDKIADLDNRVRRLEDRQRFDCDRQGRKRQQMCRKQQKIQRQYESKERNIDYNYAEVTKRLKKIEEELYQYKDMKLPKSNSMENVEVFNILEQSTTKKIKKLQKKMKKYFSSKFQQIQGLFKKSRKHKSKSPSARTPIQMSTMSQYQIDLVQRPLSQFRLEDHSVNKSDLSTILRQSKNTLLSNKNKTPLLSKKKNQQDSQKTKLDKSKSISKSKSKKKQKSEKAKNKKGRSVSKSKSRRLDKSQSLSDNSFVRSSLSRSKSNISKNQVSELRIQKKIKQNKRKRSISKSKSHHSSISMHQKCKRRPQLDIYLTNKNKSKQKVISSKKHQRKTKV